jgi:archaetidylinositol phosphate synthase
MTTPHLGYAAALLTFLGSYMGTQAQSVGLGRNYGGFGRADRLVVTIIGIILACYQALTQTWLNVTIPIINTQLNALSAILLISLIGGAYTFVIRFSTARSELLESETAPLGGDSTRNDGPDDS